MEPLSGFSSFVVRPRCHAGDTVREEAKSDKEKTGRASLVWRPQNPKAVLFPVPQFPPEPARIPGTMEYAEDDDGLALDSEVDRIGKPSQ